MGEVKDRGKGKDSVKECEEFLELAVVRGERERERGRKRAAQFREVVLKSD